MGARHCQEISALWRHTVQQERQLNFSFFSPPDDIAPFHYKVSRRAEDLLMSKEIIPRHMAVSRLKRRFRGAASRYPLLDLAGEAPGGNNHASDEEDTWSTDAQAGGFEDEPTGPPQGHAHEQPARIPRLAEVAEEPLRSLQAQVEDDARRRF